MYVFLGLMILAGVYHAKNEAVVQLWSKDHGMPIFNKAMSTRLGKTYCYLFLLIIAQVMYMQSIADSAVFVAI